MLVSLCSMVSVKNTYLVTVVNLVTLLVLFDNKPSLRNVQLFSLAPAMALILCFRCLFQQQGLKLDTLQTIRINTTRPTEVEMNYVNHLFHQRKPIL